MGRHVGQHEVSNSLEEFKTLPPLRFEAKSKIRKRGQNPRSVSHLSHINLATGEAFTLNKNWAFKQDQCTERDQPLDPIDLADAKGVGTRLMASSLMHRMGKTMEKQRWSFNDLPKFTLS